MLLNRFQLRKPEIVVLSLLLLLFMGNSGILYASDPFSGFNPPPPKTLPSDWVYNKQRIELNTWDNQQNNGGADDPDGWGLGWDNEDSDAPDGLQIGEDDGPIGAPPFIFLGLCMLIYASMGLRLCLVKTDRNQS